MLPQAHVDAKLWTCSQLPSADCPSHVVTYIQVRQLASHPSIYDGAK